MAIRKTVAALAIGAAFVAPAAHATTASAAQPLAGVKNIIILINDGAGFTVYDATRMFKGAPLTTDGAKFAKTAASTYPIRVDNGAGQHTNNVPGSTTQNPRSVYDSAKFWDTTPMTGPSGVVGYDLPFTNAGFTARATQPIPGSVGQTVNVYNPDAPFLSPAPASTVTLGNGSVYPASFVGYEFSRWAHPDSGNTASAISTGVKTYNNAINVDGAGDPQISIVDTISAAVQAGKATGVVTVVEFSDATPAALGGTHNIARANHGEIANEMFSAGKLNVVGGCGNPDYDDNGQPVATPVYSPALPKNGGGWIYQNLWTDLKNNTNLSGKNPYFFPLLQDKATIQALAARSGVYAKPPVRAAMIMKCFTSNQFNRTNTLKRTDNTPIDPTQDVVGGTPWNTGVASQADLTIAALNVLDQNGRGFYLMTEGGAVDRAEHANDTARMIEEMNASEETVQAIIDWVNRKDTAATWDNTLLIVTADHDHLLYGPNGDTVPFQPLQDNGAGQVPGTKWFGPNHGNGLVPLYAYGAGSAALISLATHNDTYTVPAGKPLAGQTLGHGAYVDQAELGAVLKATAAQTLKAPKHTH